MPKRKHSPGTVRDAIVASFDLAQPDASVSEIKRSVEAKIGDVPASSVRSYLRLRPDLFERTRHGRYRLKAEDEPVRAASEEKPNAASEPLSVHGKARLYQDDCFDWLVRREENSIHAVITDPPYGLVEYTETEQRKLREGRGGVWRIPPSFDGHRRSPLPRFTTLGKADLEHMHEFFERFGRSVSRVLVPGAAPIRCLQSTRVAHSCNGPRGGWTGKPRDDLPSGHDDARWRSPKECAQGVFRCHSHAALDGRAVALVPQSD